MSHGPLIFDADKHRYTVDGKVVPSVTRIIATALMGKETEAEPTDAMKTGTAVHLATALDDLGDLDESALDPALWGYLEAWRSFRKKADLPAFSSVEIPMYHEGWRFAGTPDRIAGERILVEIKTGKPYKDHPIQTAAYATLAHGVDKSPLEPRPWTRKCVYLAADGSYAVAVHEDAEDSETFLAALRVYNWRKGRS